MTLFFRSKIENVMDELDFKLKVSRSEVETLCESLFTRIQTPIKSLLEKSSLQMKDISSLVLVGGGIRIPIVQDVLKGLVGE